MDKRNDMYRTGNDYKQDVCFDEPYYDGIYHTIANKYKLNRRVFNKPQSEWKKSDFGAIFSPDYATVKLSDETKFSFGEDWDELVEKSDGWLFSVNYDSYNYDFASQFLRDNYFPVGACSSFQKGSIRGRNYDWFYDWHPSFLVRTSAKNGRYATIGVCTGVGDLDKNMALSKKVINIYEILPFMLLDGINEKGLIANINVCQILNDAGELDITNVTNKQEPAIPAVMFVRYILDYCANVDEVIDLVKTRNIFMANSDVLVEEFHFMVSDATGRTVVIEWKDNEPVITEEENLIMTNYKLCGQTGVDYGAGYERAKILKDGIDTVTDAFGAERLMGNIKYSNTYEFFLDKEKPDDEKWYSECNSKGVFSTGVPYDLHQGVPHSEYEYMVNAMVKMYTDFTDEERRNNHNTWQTVHSTIYDPENNRLLIKVQEQANSIEMKLDL